MLRLEPLGALKAAPPKARAVGALGGGAMGIGAFAACS